MESSLDQKKCFTEKVAMMTSLAIVKLAHSVCIGMVGSVILMLFGSLFVPGEGLLTLLPWIIGFNGLITGNSLIVKTEGRLSVKYAWLIGAGILMVLPLYFIINLTPIFAFYLSANSFFISLFIAAATTLAGGWVAVKNINYKALEKRTQQG